MKVYSYFILIFLIPLLSSAEKNNSDEYKTAIFAGGCFWCMEPPFDNLEGVISTTSGYTGGHTKNPNYSDVSSGTTGHIEAIQIKYDPKKIDYKKLLRVFWKNIDPIDGGGQFCDRGRTYQTAIFYLDNQQKELAEKTKKKANIVLHKEIATEIIAATTFYSAEDYHQDYYLKNPRRYKFYRYSCGRDKRLKEIWSNISNF